MRFGIAPHSSPTGVRSRHKKMARMLGVTYKTAWFRSHRIRKAKTPAVASLIGGEGKVVEADEMNHGKCEALIVSNACQGRPFTNRTHSYY